MTAHRTRKRSHGPLKPTGLLAAALVAVLIAAGCGSSGGGDGDSESLSLGLSVSGAPLPFYVILRESAESTAQKEGVDMNVVTPESSEDQNRSVDTLLTQQIDVLGLAPLDADAVVPAVEQANSEDVPVITVDETAAEGEIYTYIASPNESGGEKAAKWLLEELPEGGEIGVIEGESGSSTNNARMDGFRKGLQGSEVEIAAATPGDWVIDKAFQAARDMLSGNPNLKAFFAVNDQMGLGIAQAVQQSGQQGQTKIIGYNGDPAAFDAIREGTMDATVAQDPTKMGELLVENAISASEGEEAEQPEIEVPVKVVDTSNIGSVKAE